MKLTYKRRFINDISAIRGLGYVTIGGVPNDERLIENARASVHKQAHALGILVLTTYHYDISALAVQAVGSVADGVFDDETIGYDDMTGIERRSIQLMRRNYAKKVAP